VKVLKTEFTLLWHWWAKVQGTLMIVFFIKRYFETRLIDDLRDEFINGTTLVWRGSLLASGVCVLVVLVNTVGLLGYCYCYSRNET
jgi:hypothetical protein